MNVLEDDLNELEKYCIIDYMCLLDMDIIETVTNTATAQQAAKANAIRVITRPEIMGLGMKSQIIRNV